MKGKSDLSKKGKNDLFSYVILDMKSIKEVKFAFITWYIEILRFYTIKVNFVWFSYLCFQWWNQGGLKFPISKEIIVTIKSWWKAKLDMIVLIHIHTYIHIFYLNIFQVLDIFDMLCKNFYQVNISCELLEAIWYNYYYFNHLMNFISTSLPPFWLWY